MDISELVDKIQRDYEDQHNLVNGTLRYQFAYNESIIDVYYTMNAGLEQYLRFVANVNGVDYCFVEHFSLIKNKNVIKTYIDPEIYNALKFSLFFVDNHIKTAPFFNAMRNSIIESQPLMANEPQRNYYRHKNREYNPYFETTIRKHMSDKMKERIYKSYDSDLANSILLFCGEELTLRYTSDQNRANNIEVHIGYNREI